MIISVALVALGAVAVQSERPGVLLEQAYFLEQADGDLRGAIAIYARVVEAFSDDRTLAARALFRKGLCHERLGDGLAADAYARLLSDYADQERFAELARVRLAGLRRPREPASPDLPTGASLREVVLPGGGSVGDRLASLSPDGRWLAYENSSLSRLVIHDLQNRRVHQSYELSAGTGESAYRWSRDSRHVAFDAALADEWVVKVSDVEDGSLRTVFSADFATVMDWSSSGASLFIHSYSRDDGVSRIAHVTLEGELLWQLVAEGRDFRVSPSGRLVAFSGGADDDDIYLANLPDAGAPQGAIASVRPESAIRVGPHPAADRQPLWSADGEHLAFMSERTNDWDLWVVGIEEGQPGAPRLLESDLGEDVRLQDWLPGGRIVFTKRRALSDVWIQPVSPATGGATGPARLAPTRVRGLDVQPRWSPDGQWLSLRSHRESPRTTLVLSSLDGERDRVIRLSTDFQNADWSPDGRSLVYCGVGDRETFLGRFDIETGERVAAPELRLPNVFAPRVSPDGMRVLFAAAGPDGVREQFVFDTETGERRIIPNTEETYFADWSPDGRWIAVASATSICVLRPDGSSPRCLVEVAEPHRINAWISWSPDGRWIVYPRGAYVGERFDWDLFVVSFNGETNAPVGESPKLSPWWVDWSPDGKHLAMSANSGNVGLWVMEHFDVETEGR